MSSMSQRLLLWGSSGHARVVVDIVRSTGEYEIAALLDDQHPERRGQMVAGIPIAGGLDQLNALKDQGIGHLIVAIGDCAARERLAKFALENGFELATAIHKSAVVAPSAQLGAGSVVAAASVINPDARVGRNCIINTSASVDHDCVIGDAAHVGPGAHLGGGTEVGPGTWIGIGATLIDHIRVGAGSIVGAGSVVTRDVPDGVVVYGVPARIIRAVDIGKRRS
jgi:sugar O-acyltransferase (sialic acid O-acetyltransferase NeuD family)